MRGSTDDMILFGIGYFKENRIIGRDILCKGLDIRRNTLAQRLNLLRRDDLLRKVIVPGRWDHELTESGETQYEQILKDVMTLELRPELHYVPGIYKLGSILPYIRDPVIALKIIRTAVKKEMLDVVDLLGMEIVPAKLARDLSLIMEMNPEKAEMNASLDDHVRSLTFAGSAPGKPFDDTSLDSISRAISEAEHMRRRSKVREALSLYRNILETDGIPAGCWICSVVGSIQCIKAIEGPDEALAICDLFEQDRVILASHKAYILKTKADILSDLRRYEEAEKIYKTALGMARAKRSSSLQGMIMNNMGVNYFRWEKYEMAEKTWISTYRYCRSNELPWPKFMSLINLSDIEARKKKFFTARKHLRDAREFMVEIGDMEGVSEVDFNLALLCTEEGKKERALNHFRNCEGFPIVYRTKFEERRDEMKRRFQEKGWTWDHCISYKPLTLENIETGKVLYPHIKYPPNR